jgi:transcriptional regulator with XRE-family HTH domain
MKRGRPKGRSRDNRSFGPLGDLIRTARLTRGLGLADVAKACSCSVQFVSNIEHGRAPLPWEKASQLSTVLRIPLEELQAANLAIRSDFKSFVGAHDGRGNGRKTRKLSNPLLGGKVSVAASAITYAARDAQLREVISRYQSASSESRKKFVRAALAMLG